MNYTYTENPIFINEQVLKHVESLRTRLGFAQFKLNNGWQNNTLGDVECFWKKKQRQSIKDIPVPRFTQQDIIDKRAYIQASGAKHAKARRYRLLHRSLSCPGKSPTNKMSRKKSVSIQQPQLQYISGSSHDEEEEDEDDDDDDDDEGNDGNTSSSSTNSIQKQQRRYQQKLQQQLQHRYYFHHYSNDIYNEEKKTYNPTPIHSVSSFDASCVPNDLNGEPSIVKNSLDYLSYAIAMTEKSNDVEKTQEQEPVRNDDWTRTSQLRLSLSIPSPSENNDTNNSLPSSPANLAAAQTMLMFVNRDNSSII